MIEVISGRAGCGKSAFVLERVKEALLSVPDGRTIFLLLPEHMTYKVERALAAMLSEEGRGFSRCYVYGFRRFAYRILQETGGGLEQGLTELGRQLLLKQILEQRLAGKDLTAFARAARQRGFVSELSDIINEMKTYRITPEFLQELSKEIAGTDTHLQDKLNDMSLLYKDFNAAMAGKYNDGKDVLAKLLEKMPQSKLLQGAEVWLDGFLFFNPLEQEIVAKLMDICADVHITVNLDNSLLQEGSIFDNVPREDVFYRGYGTRNYLLRLAVQKELSVQEIFLQNSPRFVSPVLREIEAQWMAHHVEPLAEHAGMQFVEAATIRLELEAMAAQIVRQVREYGYKWNEIGILIRDEDSYAFMTELVLQEFNIPFFNAAKRQVMHHPLAELIRSALAICTTRQGWSYENIFCCLKTGFFKESCQLLPDALDALENYVLEFGIRGKRLWTQPEAWEFARRFNEEAEADEKELMRAALADANRRLPAEYLEKLYNALHTGKTTAALSEAVYDFLVDLQVPQQLESWAKEDEAAGNLAQAREHQQLWANIMELLDQMVELGVHEDDILLQEFAKVLEEGLDDMSLSLIPPGLDYVSIASFDQNSLDNMRAVYIVGANAGIMPKHSSENLILSDADRLHINKAEGMEQLSDNRIDKRLSVIGQENTYNEAFLLYKGFTQASEYLWVSYALSDDSGTGREPARLVKWLRRLVPTAKLWQILQGDSFVVTAKQSMTGLANALRICRDYGNIEQRWQAVYNWQLGQENNQRLTAMQRALGSRPGADKLPAELSARLFAAKGFIRGSVTRLESYNQCPFQYYARYGLKLQERRIRKFSNPELGTILHAVLREFGETLKKQHRRWSDVYEAEQQKMCHEILYRLAHKLENSILLQQEKLTAQLKRIENTANFALKRLCAFDAVSQLHPEYFEQSFGILGKDGNDKALELVYKLSKHQSLSLNGQIDRIDVTEDGQYFMVMDYKTGNASINLMDVYYGVKLQLLTYLLVASELLSREEQKPSLPVGMLYYFLKKPMTSLPTHKASQAELIGELEDKLKMPGWIVADKELVQLIDSTLSAPSSKSRFIHASTKKDGALGSSALYLRTERELELLLAYVEKLLQNTGRRILAGEIQPEPYQNRQGRTGCEYCSYRVICGFDAQLEGFGYKKVLQQKDIDFMQDIEDELSSQGVEAIDEALKLRMRERANQKEAATNGMD